MFHEVVGVMEDDDIIYRCSECPYHAIHTYDNNIKVVTEGFGAIHSCRFVDPERINVILELRKIRKESGII